MNLATLLAALLVLLMVIAMIRSLIKENRAGKGSCGCSSCNGFCSHCLKTADKGDME